MKFSEFLGRFFLVRKCPACSTLLEYERSGEAFCAACRSRWDEKKAEPCNRCSQSFCECTCMPRLLAKAGALCHHKVVGYCGEPVVQGTIGFIKKNKNPRVSAFLAEQMRQSLLSDGYLPTLLREDTLITYVPRGKKAITKYGFDQSALLAQCLSEKMDIPIFPLLRRAFSAREQKKLDAAQRAKNVKNLFEVAPEHYDKIKGKRVILIDDIVTTGASMAGCTRALIKAGAISVIALSVAYTE